MWTGSCTVSGAFWRRDACEGVRGFRACEAMGAGLQDVAQILQVCTSSGLVSRLGAWGVTHASFLEDEVALSPSKNCLDDLKIPKVKCFIDLYTTYAFLAANPRKQPQIPQFVPLGSNVQETCVDQRKPHGILRADPENAVGAFGSTSRNDS